MSTWVLLRGLTRERGHWGRFPDELAARLRGARILAVDLPGNGALYMETSPLRVEEMVARCREELRAFGVAGPCHLLALSLGAMVALAWTEAYPAEIAGCVLINTSLRGASPFHRRLRPAAYVALARTLATGSPEAAEAAILRLTSRIADAAILDDWTDLRRRHPVSRRNALRQLLAAMRFRVPASAPDVPMLVLCSRGDQLVAPRCSADLAARWHLPLVEHPWAGHDLPLDDGPWVAAEVRKWLEVPATPLASAESLIYTGV